MADKCLAQIKVCRMRICRLDGVGVPDPGSTNMYVTKAMSKITLRGVYTDGDEIKEKNGCGEQLVNVRGPDNFDRVDIEIELLTHDPYLLEMLNPGAAVLTNGEQVGFAAPNLGAVASDAISIEAFAQRVNAAGTGVDTVYPYAWWVIPWVQNLRMGDRTFENAAAKPTITGQCYENENWYDGPMDDWPVASTQVYQWLPWASLPADNCGYLSLAAS